MLWVPDQLWVRKFIALKQNNNYLFSSPLARGYRGRKAKIKYLLSILLAQVCWRRTSSSACVRCTVYSHINHLTIWSTRAEPGCNTSPPAHSQQPPPALTVCFAHIGLVLPFHHGNHSSSRLEPQAALRVVAAPNVPARQCSPVSSLDKRFEPRGNVEERPRGVPSMLWPPGPAPRSLHCARCKRQRNSCPTASQPGSVYLIASPLTCRRLPLSVCETKVTSGPTMCQQPYRHTALAQTLQPLAIEPLLLKQPQNLQSTSSAMMPPSSQLLPAQLFKPSQSELVLLPQEKVPSVDADQDPVLADLCKPLLCKLCNVSLNSTQQAQAHYQGKNHSKKLRNYYAGHQCVATPKVIHTVDQLGTQLHPPASQSGSSKAAGRVILATANDYCKLCDASFSSPAVAQAHYQGKNHAKRLRLAEAQKSNSFSEATELTKRRQRKEGNEFKIVPNRRNLHGVQNTLGPYFNPRQRIPRDLAMCVTPSGQFYCSMCNIGASEEQEFRLHLESKLHKSKVSEQRYRNEMENLGYA
ncbi:zinc finger matrin-type protein 3 [Heterodontus francisci]|uniref:zinc finger matrin-type protein 3 n=1 Tax=Heterodontus francisci TaxID=7792 RepID=UPI00355B2919